jgi:RNA-directed DNA polymerase
MYTKLRLRVNREKSRVELANRRSLLSYSFWYANGGTVLCRVALKAARALKQRVRLITRRNGGRSMRSVVVELKQYLPG